VGGVVLVDKPVQMSSHEVVKRLRKAARLRKVGHAGTLDPFATGLLLVCLEEAVRISEYLMDAEKEYVATMKLGEMTDTQDCTGQLIQTRPVPALTDTDIVQMFARFVGTLDQVPPMFSAKKIQGVRLYQLARQGEQVTRASQQVSVATLGIEEVTLPFIRFRVVCSKGTYIRTLAHDLGEAFGCGAHLNALQRVRIGRFELAQAYPLEELLRQAHQGQVLSSLIPTDVAVPEFPIVTLDARLARHFRFGTPFYLPASVYASLLFGATDATEWTIVRMYDAEGNFLGLGRGKPPTSDLSRWDIQPFKVLVDPPAE
jgi:tRNA pseudouridine55 synthase